MSIFQSKLPKIERVFEAARANEIINHPAVRPYVADLGSGAIDLAPVATHPDIFILLGEHGVFVLRRLMPGVLEVHTQVLPEGRGEWTDAFIQAGIRWVFTHTEAFEIVTRVPEGHLAAKATTIRSGMTYEFTPDSPYLFRGRLRPVHVYSIRLQEWASRAPEMEDTGAWLHERFAEEGERLGLVGEPRGEALERGIKWGELHEEKPSHNRYVGLAYHMALGGNAGRGVALYNRWALASHRPKHMQSRLLSTDPVCIWFDHTELTLLSDGDIRLSLEREVTPWAE